MTPVDSDLPPILHQLDGEYELIREIGSGGPAVVHLARERDTGRLVAIKAIRRRLLDDEETVSRFAREADTASSLDHPNIVRTYAVEREHGRPLAIVMQFVPGGTLRDRLLEHGALSFADATLVLRDVAEALRYAHAKGIVHRDVKPENIFLDIERERALLSDFGVARAVDDRSALTMVGSTIGTPTYMAPEQLDSAPLDVRSDIYSLGLVGWEMLAGRRPWEGESIYGVIYKQKHEELPRLTELRPGIPAGLLFAIEGALHKHHDTRWASIDEFLAELDDETLAAPYVPRPRDEPAPSRGSRVPPAARTILLVSAALVAVLAIAAHERAPTGDVAAPAPDSLLLEQSAGSVAQPVESTPSPDSTVAPAAETTAAPAPPAPRTASAGRLTHADSLALCSSPAAEHQRACLLSRLAESDLPLNRTYQALITRLRAESGAREPRSVQQLRVAQRAWIVERDTECRRRGGGREGRLWAPSRADCLAELSRQRTAELQAELDQHPRG